jgi:hypothetical protein
MLLSRFEMKAPVPPETVLARLQADVRSPDDQAASRWISKDTFLETPAFIPSRLPPIADNDQLYGHVDNRSFQIWLGPGFVRLRGRVSASASGSRIIGAAYLKPQAIFAWAFLGLLLLLGAGIPMDPRYYSPHSRIPWYAVWLIIWLLSSLPLSLLVFAAARKSKSRLTQSIHMAAGEHRLRLDSPPAEGASK